MTTMITGVVRLGLIGGLVAGMSAAAWAGDRIDYNRDVRPILGAHCLHCHGIDDASRQGGIRLDCRDAAIRPADSDAVPIVPGDPDSSALVDRVFAADEGRVMPPADGGVRPLSEEQKRILRRWVAEGAAYDDHWAFVAPRSPSIPTVRDASWPRNPIDAFVLADLESRRLKPSPEASRAVLIRRLSLDLTGLPPTAREVENFLADPASDAYEKAVDRLLDSPHHGERMAQQWLDFARYGDSNGYDEDFSRDMTAWRDWVIAAFNRNMPFDQFTIEQLAGDLLPNPTRDQIVATGFNRNHRLNAEAGILPEEWRIETVVDRVETTGVTWLGLTLGCARCHDHKYDPVSQREFYELFAFFNNVDESGVVDEDGKNTEPILALPDAAQRRECDRLREHTAAAAVERHRTGDEGALEAARLEEKTFAARIPTTMVMRELPEPRDTFVLTRGLYDQPGEWVVAATPAFLPPLPVGQPANRLGLARWIVDPAHPLTARVWVNRAWERLFGIGLTKTSDNLGVQGEYPSHPRLLDWLATEFVRCGWDMKAIQRLIVTSATYRQASSAPTDGYRADPDNRLLARGSRFRLSAETIRDQALAVSGLLVPRIGGPAARPYMPEGVWDDTSDSGDMLGYRADEGEGLYRRTMYTIWKRTAAPPTLLLFDAPTRETCIVTRQRTNTPLQALALLNEVTFIEAARALADRMMREGGATIDGRLATGFRLVTGREMLLDEARVLRAGLASDLERFRRDPQAAARLIDVGRSRTDSSLAVDELAAFTMVGNVLLNLDEVIVRE